MSNKLFGRPCAGTGARLCFCCFVCSNLECVRLCVHLLLTSFECEFNLFAPLFLCAIQHRERRLNLRKRKMCYCTPFAMSCEFQFFFSLFIVDLIRFSVSFAFAHMQLFKVQNVRTFGFFPRFNFISESQYSFALFTFIKMCLFIFIIFPFYSNYSLFLLCFFLPGRKELVHFPR